MTLISFPSIQTLPKRVRTEQISPVELASKQLLKDSMIGLHSLQLFQTVLCCEVISKRSIERILTGVGLSVVFGLIGEGSLTLSSHGPKVLAIREENTLRNATKLSGFSHLESAFDTWGVDVVASVVVIIFGDVVVSLLIFSGVIS